MKNTGKEVIRKWDVSRFSRVVDANANRVREGLRVVEEINRLVLENEELTAAFKEARHRVTAILKRLPADLVEKRDSDADVGKDLYYKGESNRTDCREVAIINARRAEEGIRVLEEFSKLVSSRAGEEFKKLRFKIYSLEKKTLELM